MPLMSSLLSPVSLVCRDEFKSYDYQKIFDLMMKPAFLFDGRNILDHGKLRQIGFEVEGIGKPQESELVSLHAMQPSGGSNVDGLGA